MAISELALANARTVEEYAGLLRVLHLPYAILVLSLPWFVYVLFRTGRRWLALLSNALYVAVLTINLFSPYSRLFKEITAIERHGLLGDEFTHALGTAHPGRWIGQVATLVLLVFVADAAFTLWKQGGRRRAAIVGGAVFASAAFGVGHSALVSAGMIHSPYMVSVGFLVLLGGMAYELVDEALHAVALGRQVKHQAAALAVQRAEVAHLSRVTMLSEMSSSISHELNQPLTAILSNSQAALRFLNRETPDLDEVRSALEAVVAEDRYASAVIERLRTLLRKEEPRTEPLDVNLLVNDVLQLADIDLERERVRVSTGLTNDLPAIRGDRVLLFQVLLNLLRNAADAMSEIEPVRRQIHIRSEAVNDGVEISVSDRGPGIPPGDVERVFQPFFTTRPEGSGLGLAVSRTIVHMHGGTIRVTAGGDGTGAALHVFLPVEQSAGES